MIGIKNYGVGEWFNGSLLIKKTAKGIASNGSPFLTIIFQDQSGEIEAKLWDVTEEQSNTFVEGKIVNVAGTVTEFRGKLQLTVSQIEINNNEDVINYVKNAPINKNDVWNELMNTIQNMKNEKIKQITAKILEKYKEKFLLYPAASGMHHAYAGGLAYHTISMLKIAKSLCQVYPELNSDLLYAGVILHDIKKCEEYTGILNIKRTLEGKLKGHIVMISEEIAETAKELNIEGEEVLLLQTIVLSHHHKGEWGSPVSPQIMEAEILHYIDMIDAKMEMMRTALENTEKGNWTERLPGLENRSFYKPTII